MIRSILAVISGFAASVVGVTTMFSLIMVFALGGLPDDPKTFHPPGWLVWIEILSAPVIAAIGGYVCAWIAMKSEIGHGLALAAVLLVMGAVSAFAEPGTRPIAAVVLVPVLGAIGAVAGAYARRVVAGL